MQYDIITELLGIQGFKVSHIEHREQQVAVTHLERVTEDYRCGQCGRTVSEGYDSCWQEIQHLTFWQHGTILRFKRYRVNCPDCGIKTEALDFVQVRGPRVTKMLAHLICELCKVTTNKAVAIFFRLHPMTVKNIDKQKLAEVQAQRPLDGITVLGADELHLGSKSNYLSLFSALKGPRGPEMLYAVEGHTEKKFKEFWRWFGKGRAALVTHAVMDMYRAFENSFRAHCGPGLQIIYDKFHIVRHLNNALNAVRKSALHSALGRFKKTLSGKKFILLSRRARIRGKARTALNDVLIASPKLYKAHLLKESFGRLWSYTYKGCAIRFWKHWKSQLKRSRLKPYNQFVRMVDKHFDGILAYCDNKVPLGYIESCNQKARNIIRRAYGFQDKEYLKLKIIQTCTPWMAKFNPWSATHS